MVIYDARRNQRRPKNVVTNVRKRRQNVIPILVKLNSQLSSAEGRDT